MNFSKKFKEASHFLKQKNTFLLAVHERPDGDALGAMTAMFSVLANLENKNIKMFSKDSVPEHLQFLPHAGEITYGDAGGCFGASPPDIFIGFDYGDFKRLGVAKDIVLGSTWITFDHHPQIKQEGDILIIDDTASSTCEILYEFFIQEGFTISPHTATALLTGIFTDSGGFVHFNTSPRTLRASADLMCRGASIAKIYKHAFCGKSPNALRAWGHALRNVFHDKESGLAYVGVSFDEFIQLGECVDDFEGVANLINLPPDVRFSLLLIEYKPGTIKGSLRSESFKGVDVSMIARELGGGGHKYAAGFERTGESMENVVKLVKQAARYPSG